MNTLIYTIHVHEPTKASMGLHHASVMSEYDSEAGIQGVRISEGYGRGIERAVGMALKKLGDNLLQSYPPEFEDDL